MRWADDIENWFGGQGDVETRFEKCQRALKLFSSRAHELIRTFAARGEGRGVGGGEDSGAGEGRTIAEELVLASERGELESDDIVPNLFFLMSAGHETTASLISNGILLCLDRPEVLRQLKLVAWRGGGGRDVEGDGRRAGGEETERDGGHGAELELEFDDLITEMLRIITPITRAYREVAADFKYKGIDMKKGQQVQFNFAAANIDPLAFPPDPEEFRAGRMSRNNVNRHLAFGFRDHLCPGLKLGRLTTKALHSEKYSLYSKPMF